jgi:hypothetical protein
MAPETTKKKERRGVKKSECFSFSVFVQCTQCNRPSHGQPTRVTLKESTGLSTPKPTQQKKVQLKN